MFDSSFDFLSLVIAIAAFILARKAFNQNAALRARLDLMETLAASAAAARPVPPARPEPKRSAKSRHPANRHRRRFREPRLRSPIVPLPRPPPSLVPVSRSASAPAGWSGSAA